MLSFAKHLFSYSYPLSFKRLSSRCACAGVWSASLLSDYSLRMAFSSVSSGIQESVVIACEGEGTWVTWKTTSPERIEELYMASVMRLHERYYGYPIDPTDSDDGTVTKHLRYVAHTNKVLAGCMGWQGYESYRFDFESAELSSDPILRKLRADVEQRLSSEDADPKIRGLIHSLSPVTSVTEARSTLQDTMNARQSSTSQEPKVFPILGYIVPLDVDFCTPSARGCMELR